MNNTHTEGISFRISANIKAEIEAAAARESRKLAPFVQALVEWAFTQYEKVGDLLVLREIRPFVPQKKKPRV